MPDKYEPTTATYDPFKVQVAGNHYAHFAIQPTEFIQRNNLTWGEGNVIKYICRHRFKNQPLEDLRKAKHYCEILIALEERKQNGSNSEDVK